MSACLFIFSELNNLPLLLFTFNLRFHHVFLLTTMPGTCLIHTHAAGESIIFDLLFAQNSLKRISTWY